MEAFESSEKKFNKKLSLTGVQIFNFALQDQHLSKKHSHLLSLIISLFHTIEKTKLICNLINHQKAELLTAIFERAEIGEKERIEIVQLSFCQSMELEDLSLAIKILKVYTVVLHKHPEQTCEAICSSFQKSSSFVESKFYVLNSFFNLMSADHFDRILSVFEATFKSKTKNYSNCLVSNQNPILASALIMDFLTKF